MDELLDMPSDVDRAARVKVGSKNNLISEHVLARDRRYIQAVFSPSAGLTGRLL